MFRGGTLASVRHSVELDLVSIWTHFASGPNSAAKKRLANFFKSLAFFAQHCCG